MSEIGASVEGCLTRFFEERRAILVDLAPEAAELLEAVRALTMRGGKRLRPAVLFAAHRAIRPEAGGGEVVEAGAALELLQSYLLIHDDWMDGDETRRGGPSTHASLRDAHGDAHLGASLAVLAGNLACAWSWALIRRATDDPSRQARAQAVVLRMHEEVLVGQQLDLLAVEDVGRMQQLKTGSYTLRGPLALGAALAGASDAQAEALDRYGIPLGEAFQMRDDLLGTFGDPSTTGKPAGNDLRAGKRTALIATAEPMLDAPGRAALETVFGRADATDADVKRAMDALEAAGARTRLEERLDALVSEARAALEGAPLAEPGIQMLGDLAARLTLRRV